MMEKCAGLDCKVRLLGDECEIVRLGKHLFCCEWCYVQTFLGERDSTGHLIHKPDRTLKACPQCDVLQEELEEEAAMIDRWEMEKHAGDVKEEEDA